MINETMSDDGSRGSPDEFKQRQWMAGSQLSTSPSGRQYMNKVTM